MIHINYIIGAFVGLAVAMIAYYVAALSTSIEKSKKSKDVNEYGKYIIETQELEYKLITVLMIILTIGILIAVFYPNPEGLRRSMVQLRYQPVDMTGRTSAPMASIL